MGQVPSSLNTRSADLHGCGVKSGHRGIRVALHASAEFDEGLRNQQPRRTSGAAEHLLITKETGTQNANRICAIRAG